MSKNICLTLNSVNNVNRTETQKCWRLLCTSKISRESLFKIKSNSANRSETTNKQKKKDFEKLKLENNKLMQDNVKLHDKHGYQVQRNER